jgi:hypothetical protein
LWGIPESLAETAEVEWQFHSELHLSRLDYYRGAEVVNFTPSNYLLLGFASLGGFGCAKKLA